MNHNKNFYVVIPAKLLYDKNIPSTAKLLAGAISNLSNELGYCFASNGYLSDLLGCSKRSIQQNLRLLEDAGYFQSVIKVNEKGEITMRAIYPINQAGQNGNEYPVKNISPPHEKNFTTPHEKNFTHKNKVIKNKEEKISFGDFWDLYDKKTGDKKALKKKWDSFPLETQKMILDFIPKYKKYQPEKKYRKNPSTFFNQSGWLDEEISNSVNQTKPFEQMIAGVDFKMVAGKGVRYKDEKTGRFTITHKQMFGG